ncbi:hypothetical protein O181_052564 [Austropuccinia psidii MF-1]|uniref:Uncharacterized protein n=1 Tax=Austropuccinia psidii MF-1 TaxID=1389203 RepID=A0A9Q3E0Y4_9BASI|nr:hypothetical protein [Austropuccinia psidii MF-1]
MWGPNHQSRTSPSTLGGVIFFLVLDLGNVGENWPKATFLVPWTPWNPWGTLIAPTDCGVWTMDHRDKKSPWPQMGLDTKNSRMDIDMERTQKHPKAISEAISSRTMGKRPLLVIMKGKMIIMMARRGPKINLTNS